MKASRDLRVIVPYTILTVALFVLLGVKAITWQEFVVGLGLLNVPAFFGLPPSTLPPGAPSVLPPPFSPAISEKSERELVALGDSLGPSTFPRKNDQ